MRANCNIHALYHLRQGRSVKFVSFPRCSVAYPCVSRKVRANKIGEMEPWPENAPAPARNGRQGMNPKRNKTMPRKLIGVAEKTTFWIIKRIVCTP